MSLRELAIRDGFVRDVDVRDVVVAVTGASGSIYAIRLIEALLAADRTVHLVVSGAAKQVLLRELEAEFPSNAADESTWRLMLSGTLESALAKSWGFVPLESPHRRSKTPSESLETTGDQGESNSPRTQGQVLQNGETSSRGLYGRLRVHGINDYSAGIASGSFLTDGMVICPCSMGTLSAIATGASTNLIHRAADVHLKERRPLILVPRETPLSIIQLENMTRLSHAGATVLPSMPGFYHQPRSIADLTDFVVARICDHLRVPHSLMQRWGEA